MMDVKLAFGVRDGKTILISELTEAERGGNCNCTCPACGEPLIAKMGNKNRHHFAHKTDSTCDIAHANESALHRYAKEIIQAHKRILLPGWEITEDDFFLDCAEIDLPSQDPIYCFYTFISSEKQIKDIIPDAIIKIKDNELIVEIKVTHAVDSNKSASTQKLNFPMFEIDLHNLLNDDLTTPETKEKIKKAVLDEVTYKHWIYNPKKEKCILQIQDLLEEKRREEIKKQSNIKRKYNEKNKQKGVAKNGQPSSLMLPKNPLPVTAPSLNKELAYWMQPNNYIKEVKHLRNDKEASKWVSKLNLSPKISSINVIPFYLDIPITGEFIFMCDRRIWQGKLFEQYICHSQKLSITNIRTKILNSGFPPLYFNQKLLKRETINIDGQDKELFLPEDVLKRYFDYLCILGFITWEEGYNAISIPPTSLAPPNAHIAEALQEAIRTVDPYHPNVDRRIEEELRKRIPDDPIWKNPYLSYTLKNTVYYAPSQK